MNDRFKFRTYIPDLKFFKYWGWIEECHYVNMCACGDYSMPELLKNYTSQSTGLKDENGKLIYEGDIVKSFHVSSTMQGRVLTGFVAYDNERCRYCILENKNCGYATFSDTDDVFEVIGNIYENKELLNENS